MIFFSKHAKHAWSSIWFVCFFTLTTGGGTAKSGNGSMHRNSVFPHTRYHISDSRLNCNSLDYICTSALIVLSHNDRGVCSLIVKWPCYCVFWHSHIKATLRNYIFPRRTQFYGFWSSGGNCWQWYLFLGSGHLLPGGGSGNFDPWSEKNFQRPTLSRPAEKSTAPLAAREKCNPPLNQPSMITWLLIYFHESVVRILRANYEGPYDIGGSGGFSPRRKFYKLVLKRCLLSFWARKTANPPLLEWGKKT